MDPEISLKITEEAQKLIGKKRFRTFIIDLFRVTIVANFCWLLPMLLYHIYFKTYAWVCVHCVIFTIILCSAFSLVFGASLVKKGVKLWKDFSFVFWLALSTVIMGLALVFQVVINLGIKSIKEKDKTIDQIVSMAKSEENCSDSVWRSFFWIGDRAIRKRDSMILKLKKETETQTLLIDSINNYIKATKIQPDSTKVNIEAVKDADTFKDSTATIDTIKILPLVWIGSDTLKEGYTKIYIHFIALKIHSYDLKHKTIRYPIDVKLWHHSETNNPDGTGGMGQSMNYLKRASEQSYDKNGNLSFKLNLFKNTYYFHLLLSADKMKIDLPPHSLSKKGVIENPIILKTLEEYTDNY